MPELITRLREAEGADRSLDAEIAFACGWRPHMPKRHQNNPRARYEQCTVNPGTYELWIGGQPCGKEKHVPKYTESLDAALALVAEVLPGAVCRIKTGLAPTAIIQRTDDEHWAKSPYRGLNAASPAIALLIALLQAQGAQE